MRSKIFLGVLILAAAVSPAFGQTPSATGSTALGTTATGTTATGTPNLADKTTITFADAGSREVWVQGGVPTGPTADSIKPSSSAVEVPLAGKNPTDTVYIWDHKTGNMATTTVAELQKAVTLSLDPKAFDHVAEIKVRVEHADQPVATAVVTVDDGAKPQTEILDPTTKGELTFFNLKPGSLKIGAQVKAKDGSQKTASQTVDAALGHGDPAAIAVVTIPDDVATLAPVATPAGTASPTSSTANPGGPPSGAQPVVGNPGNGSLPNSGNPLGSAFAYFLGLAIVAGLLYFAWRYAKQNPDAVQTKLQQLGVDVPKPGDDARQYDPVGAPMPRKADPPQKIMLDNSAPEPLAAGTLGQSPMGVGPINLGQSSNVVTATGEPRLLSEGGDAMTLPDGETVVGRDVGLGLSLVGESTVSRRHAHLVRQGNEVTVTDLGSTNGTYVNGMALSGPQTLRPGDTVQFGAVRFRFEA